MTNTSNVIKAANQLAATKDRDSLELLVGMLDRSIEKNPALKEEAYFEPTYDGSLMGPLDEVKKIGRRILKRWNESLHSIVCGKGKNEEKDRKAILDSLNLGESAVIGAVATVLLGLGVAGAVAAALAPLIVKWFIWPAKDELCQGWAELMAMSH